MTFPMNTAHLLYFNGNIKVGLCANQALTTDGEIAPRLQDPSIIASTGVRWVRLNFMQIGDRWLDRYGEIVDDLRGWGLQIYATLSHDVVGHPGLVMQDTPQGTPAEWPDRYPAQLEWIERYIEVCETILDAFQGRIGVYETLNEPDPTHQMLLRPEDQKLTADIPVVGRHAFYEILQSEVVLQQCVRVHTELVLQDVTTDREDGVCTVKRTKRGFGRKRGSGV